MATSNWNIELWRCERTYTGLTSLKPRASSDSRDRVLSLQNSRVELFAITTLTSLYLVYLATFFEKSVSCGKW